MTLMIRCHGSPPLFTLFRPIAAHRTVSIFEKKKLSPALLLDHIPAWTLSLQILLSYWPAKLYRVFYDMFIDSRCFYEKRDSELHFHTFRSCQMNNVLFNFTYLSYIQCFSGVASIEWKLLSKNSKVTGSCLPVHSGEGSYTSHFVNKISCFHR